MSHKYNPRQMLFVKNVPQDSASRIAALFTPYKPLETKNLYPDSRITTFMVALPNVGATEEALRHTDGLRVASTVISVERYNARQSTVARRGARKMRSTRVGQREYLYDDDEDDEFDGYEASEEKSELPTIEEDMAPRIMNPSAKQVRKVCTDGGVSWANVASGTLSVQSSLSPAPAVKAHIEQSPSLTTRRQVWDSRPSETDGTGSDQHTPSWEDTFIATTTTPIRPPPGFETPIKPPPGFEHLTPQSLPWPAPVSLRQPPGVAQFPASTPSGTHYYTAPEHSALTQATQTQGSESSRVEVNSSQHTHVPDVAQQQRGMLAMDWNTTRSNRLQHCKDCAFCHMREASRLRQETEWQEMTRTDGPFKWPRML